MHPGERITGGREEGLLFATTDGATRAMQQRPCTIGTVAGGRTEGRRRIGWVSDLFAWRAERAWWF